MSSNLFMDTFSITNTKVIKQIENQIDNFHQSIVRTAFEVEKDSELKRLLKSDYDNTREQAIYIYTLNQKVDHFYNNFYPNNVTMLLMNKRGEAFNANFNIWDPDDQVLLNHPITRQLDRSNNQIEFSLENSSLTNHKPMIIAGKALREASDESPYGYYFAAIKERDLRSFYEGFTSEGNNILLMAPNGKIISSNKKNYIGLSEPRLLSYANDLNEYQAEYRNIRVFDKDYTFLVKYLPSFGVYLINLVDQNLVAKNVINTNEILLISAFIVCISLFIAVLIIRRMTVPLSDLVNQISDMARYQFNKPLEVKGGYEARKIAESFNYMLNELHDYVKLLLRTQEKQRKAELKALQHQINPHFIYNTLASIKFMTQQGKIEEVSQTIESFIALLQHALTNIEETITVEQEIIHLKNYTKVNQSRYGDRIQVNFLVSPDSLECRLPKLVLQPFVENAFFHAFIKKKRGVIQILIAVKDNKLVCEVMDNGDGMDKEQRHSKEEQNKQLYSGIGIRNVDERIKLLYGNKYGVETKSELGIGTRVKITLPFIDS
ncbi:sensor histidine kinase [Paraliobacillus sp. PM-2]|uniref:sensor histidine kinase n=1 Tax=Paraliobacillus sp. PM-2 TaxID=1462524 RepID=UPI0021005367|nr:sensor histidine kinase [Paraliobacillus sp. PM-2]